MQKGREAFYKLLPFFNLTKRKKIVMSERNIVGTENGIYKSKGAKQNKKDKIVQVPLDAQERLAEILTDSPRLVNLKDTEWEIRALRMGTQWLISKKCVEIAKADNSTFGDVIKQFAINIPAVLDVLTLALLNDRCKIFADGVESKGYSDLYYATRNTLEWECDVTQFGNLLFEVLSMLSVDFFYNALTVLDTFRASVTERKRMMTKTAEQR